MSTILARPLLAALLAVLGGFAAAQNGVSTAGDARTRYLGARGVLPAAREVVVEDIVNYHRHDIARPKAGEAVGLDVRWSREGRDAVLQVGLSTALATDRAHLRPINLTLVIDKSGSMAASDKLTRVKQALLTLVSKLRDTDTLALVTFDSDARTLLPAHSLRDREAIREAIGSIEPGSSTNLNAGLMLGYEEDLKAFRKDATNRVILLTDGIANQGVTDPAKIAQASLGFNDRGIDLSTIGVGRDLNERLLQTIAKRGHGLYHFVADDGDIQKVFSNEVQSLLSPVARDATLRVAFGPGLRLQKVYGYEPKIREGSVDLALDDMNSGMTEVVMMRFRPDGEIPGDTAKVSLAYHDLDRDKAVARTGSARLGKEADPSVEKNATIAELAQAMRDMAAANEAGKPDEARRVLDAAVALAHRRYPSMEDEDVRRVLTTAERYQTVLRPLDDEARGEGLIPNGDFSRGNVGFSSELPYIAPRENGLWDLGYTVAPRWNAPLLHRLFAGGEYAAPFRPRGDEQVFYANAGGRGALTLWSADVRVKPHTRYRIRFQAISLNADRESIPDLQIAAGADRGTARPAGYGGYAENSMVWDSGEATTTTIRIVRLPRATEGRLLALANVEMVPDRREGAAALGLRVPRRR